MADMHLLSIVIPTRNRAAYLAETLKNIAADLEFKVEVVIVDGMSIDNTEEVVMDFKSSYPYVNYLRMTTVEGFDRELDLGVIASRGTFTWVFSDDDIITGKDINNVVSYLSGNHQIDLLLVNASIWNKELKRCLQNKFVDHPDYSSAGTDELFEKFVDYMSFIGGCILRKEYWLNGSANRYYGTLFVHVGIIFSQKEVRWKWVDTPMVKIRYGNASWSAKAQNIWMRKWPDLLMSFDTVSLSLRKKKVTVGAFSIFKKLVFFKAVNCYDNGIGIELKYVSNRFFAEKLACIVKFIPRKICFVLSFISARLYRKETMLYDLKKSVR